jgi:hypothetical protein
MSGTGNEVDPQKAKQVSGMKQSVARPMLDEDQIIRRTDLLAETIVKVVVRKQQQRNDFWGITDW